MEMSNYFIIVSIIIILTEKMILIVIKEHFYDLKIFYAKILTSYKVVSGVLDNKIK